MKTKIHLIALFILGAFTAKAQNVEEKVANPGFETNLTGWTLSSSAHVTRQTSGGGTTDYARYVRMQRTGSTGTAMTLTTPITAVNPTNGYIKIKFDLRLNRTSTNNPSFQIQTGSGSTWTTFLTITKNGTNTFNPNLQNSAILSYGLKSMPDDTFRTITVLIPSTTAYSGNLRFSYISNANGNYADIDNVSVTSLNTAAVTCTPCFFTVAVDNAGNSDFNETAPIPVCKPDDPTDNKYYYYLPAIAAQPTSVDASNATPPAQIQITTEVSHANLKIKSTNGSIIASGSVNNTAKYSYTTPLNTIFTNTFKSPYNNLGYIVESDQPVTVRWRLNNNVNRMQVVLRGQTALGSAFRLASVLNSSDYTSPNGAHYYTVLATENNTRVQIGNPSIPSTISTVTLNAGQQYSDTFMVKSVSGMLILTDKPVAVASGQQHRRIYSGSTSLEGTVLQVAPFRSLGKEYIAVSTEAFSGFQVVAVENGTSVYRNGELVTVLNGGESHQVYNRMPTDSLFGKPVRISTSKPAYVYELGSNSQGEFELYPAPPADLPVGKAGKIIYDQDHGIDGWVIVNSVDASKLRRNGSASLGYTNNWTLPAVGSLDAKTVYYWNNVFSPLTVNEITCTNCSAMYVGQLNDGGASGAQVGYITSFDVEPIQFFNTEFLPAELLTNGYIYDSVNYFNAPPSIITHTVTIASSGGGAVTIDSVNLARASGNADVGTVQSISGLSFTVTIPAASSVPYGMHDTVNTTVYVKDDNGNVAALCLSYLLENFEPLPVDLQYFTAKKVAKEAILDWKTVKEMNNKGFVIQRSTDSKKWTDIAWVDAKSITENALEYDYTYVDAKPLEGRNFYRLKQVDNDLNFTLSQVKSLFFDKESNSITLSPNPANNQVSINGLYGTYKLKMVDVMGRVVLETEVSSLNEYKLDISKFNSGTYAIGLMNEQNKWEFFKLQIVK